MFPINSSQQSSRLLIIWFNTHLSSTLREALSRKIVSKVVYSCINLLIRILCKTNVFGRKSINLIWTIKLSLAGMSWLQDDWFIIKQIWMDARCASKSFQSFVRALSLWTHRVVKINAFSCFSASYISQFLLYILRMS